MLAYIWSDPKLLASAVHLNLFGIGHNLQNLQNLQKITRAKTEIWKFESCNLIRIKSDDIYLKCPPTFAMNKIPNLIFATLAILLNKSTWEIFFEMIVEDEEALTCVNDVFPHSKDFWPNGYTIPLGKHDIELEM